MVFALVVVGITGLIPELLLLKHFESLSQLIPLVSLGLGLAASVAVTLDPSRRAVRAFQLMMAIFVVAGLLGVYFHLKGNVEWALERNSELSGMQLVWKTIRGATPALAPGALAQIGLLGLAWSHRHPAINAEDTAKEIDS